MRRPWLAYDLLLVSFGLGDLGIMRCGDVEPRAGKKHATIQVGTHMKRI
jgi:hypothetical protein